MSASLYNSDLIHNDEAEAQDFFALLKPRVMSLVVFTGIVGLLLTPESINPILGLIAILCISVGSGAAGAINMWYDHDIDQIMQRTQKRPLPQGKINPETALGFGIFLSVSSVVVMGLIVNAMAAFYLGLAILYYVFIYTMWLKRSTPQNVVIGGAAGAFPPLIGWVSVTGNASIEAWILFLIIFLWTPPHSWALALYRNDDYQKANVPMLPVVAGKHSTLFQIWAYTLLLIGATVLPYTFGFMGPLYLTAAGLLGVGFLGANLYLTRSSNPKAPLKVFFYSIFYLFLLFAVMLVDKFLV
jgi:protoheme IX farnesyltransferase